MRVHIRPAAIADLPVLVPLFDTYRVFYEQPSDVSAAEAFLEQRFERADSKILLAFRSDDVAIGFTQLFPSFSSVAMRRIFVLNDLFVAETGRRSGVGKALLDAAHAYAGKESAVRVSLKTAVGNLPAQRLYESIGYERDEAFYYYDFTR
jgi:GNAT superfamily N-acetyltransferase